MTVRVQTLFEALPSRGCIEDLGLIIDTIRDVYDVDHVAYAALSLGSSYAIASTPRVGALAKAVGFWTREGPTLAAVTYPLDWGQRYRAEGYDRIDPVLEGASRSFVPVNWKNLVWDTAKRKRFLKEAVECGIGNQGYTIPLHGPDGQFAVFAINSNMSDAQWENLITEFASDLLVVSHFFHQRVLEIERIFGPPPTPKLSSRETDVLRSIASGKSRAQVAHDLKISENTLRVYIDSARVKLGALNIPHAVAIGLSRGIINI